MASSSALSEYEKRRLENIKRNDELLVRFFKVLPVVHWPRKRDIFPDSGCKSLLPNRKRLLVQRREPGKQNLSVKESH